VPGDIARDQRGAHPGRLERRHLLVHRADDHPLLIAQHGRVDRAWNVVLGEFERRAHVDDFIEAREFGERRKQTFQFGNAKMRGRVHAQASLAPDSAGRKSVIISCACCWPTNADTRRKQR
jgi:hypothetical protein